jgi:hypothetical protein
VRQAACRRMVLRRASQLNACALGNRLGWKASPRGGFSKLVGAQPAAVSRHKAGLEPFADRFRHLRHAGRAVECASA